MPHNPIQVKLFPKQCFFTFVALCILPSTILSQAPADTASKDQRWNFHFQSTVIGQYHPGFSAKYSGRNSLKTVPESPVSVTGTLYFGVKLWKGFRVYFNPEVSVGRGFSETTGVAAFPNGEIYRVSDPAPHIYVARLYFEQIFPLSGTSYYEPGEIDKLAQYKPESYIVISGGKFSMMDFYDDNKYSHDPRTQFFNWALMGNGAWDYPANTRGYTYGLNFELIKPSWTLRFSTVMVSKAANGAVMDFNIRRSHAMAMEFEHNYHFRNQQGKIRLMTYLNNARMGNYRNAIDWGMIHSRAPDVDSVHRIGNSKYGFGINIEQALSENAGMFLRAGWNDGLNQTWMFTEIDHHISAGLVFNGSLWNRSEDKFGIAQVIDGLSRDHKDYLKAGGYGFIIGDGSLNYRPEFVTELYYSFKLTDYQLFIGPDYQFIVNVAYNKDRGPVHAFGIRVHFEL